MQVRRSRAIENERLKEAKINQRKLNIYMKQSQKVSHIKLQGNLDEETKEDDLLSNGEMSVCSINGGFN